MMLCLGVLVLWCCGFVMSVDVERNILPPAGCPMLLLGSTSLATFLYEHIREALKKCKIYDFVLNKGAGGFWELYFFVLW